MGREVRPAFAFVDDELGRSAISQDPIAQVDVWRAANILVKQHGEDAAIIAAQRADALLAEGDVEGERVFKEIVKAINELQRGKPGEGERVN